MIKRVIHRLKDHVDDIFFLTAFFSCLTLKKVFCFVFVINLICFCCYRYAPSKRWHIDTIMRVLTTVRVSKNTPPSIDLKLLSLYNVLSFVLSVIQVSP